MVKFNTDAFDGIKPFDTFTWNDIIELFLENQRKILETGKWTVSHGIEIDHFPIDTENEDYIGFRHSGYYRDSEYGDRVTAKCDISGKQVSKKCIKDGKFIYLPVPKDFINKNVTSSLHNAKLEIIKQYVREIENNMQDWKKIQEKYNLKYPEMTDHHLLPDPVYKWSRDFSMEWYMSLKEDGIMNPLIFFEEKVRGRWLLNGRGTHRTYLTALAGYDMPLFLRVDNEQNPVYENDRIEAIDKIEINMKSKVVKFHYDLHKAENIYEEVRY